MEEVGGTAKPRRSNSSDRGVKPSALAVTPAKFIAASCGRHGALALLARGVFKMSVFKSHRRWQVQNGTRVT